MLLYDVLQELSDRQVKPMMNIKRLKTFVKILFSHMTNFKNHQNYNKIYTNKNTKQGNLILLKI